MIFVDLDNTLIENQFDVDLTKNLNLFLKTWQGLNTIPANKYFIEWLKDKEFILMTNRAKNTKNKVTEHLKELNLVNNCHCFIFCEGQKSQEIKHIRQKASIFLIDNNKTYSPNVLLSKNTTIWDLNYQYKKWRLSK